MMKIITFFNEQKMTIIDYLHLHILPLKSFFKRIDEKGDSNQEPHGNMLREQKRTKGLSLYHGL